jgi:phage tail protein X
MMIQTKDGDMVDDIAQRYYGSRSGETTARVLNANPQLCEYPARLPAGLQLTIPAVAPAAVSSQRIKLWD